MGLTVAVVDDEPAVRKALMRLLRTAGYEAKEYPGAEAFLDALAHERFACLILDVRMAGMSGLELQAGVSFRRARVPTIVVTACDDSDARASMLAAGATAYLTKPVDGDELLAAVQAAGDSGMSGS